METKFTAENLSFELDVSFDNPVEANDLVEKIAKAIPNILGIDCNVSIVNDYTKCYELICKCGNKFEYDTDGEDLEHCCLKTLENW